MTSDKALRNDMNTGEFVLHKNLMGSSNKTLEQCGAGNSCLYDKEGLVFSECTQGNSPINNISNAKLFAVVAFFLMFISSPR